MILLVAPNIFCKARTAIKTSLECPKASTQRVNVYPPSLYVVFFILVYTRTTYTRTVVSVRNYCILTSSWTVPRST